jgi:hypothetical protein
MNLSRKERGRGRRSYQAIWIVEATLVASLASSRKSRCPEISHQSSSCRQQDPITDETIVLVRKKLRNHVREVRYIEIKEKVQKETKRRSRLTRNR